MVKGLDLFRKHFSGQEKSFVLIGGVACHEWFADLDLEFRATKDLDVVLIVETLSADFVGVFWQFIEAGGYKIREGVTRDRLLYRFSNPEHGEYPAMLELFSRKPDRIDLGSGQRIIPIASDDIAASLSAILLDDAYYKLIREHQEIRDGLPCATAMALIPLKARAWLDLSQRKDRGEKVDDKNVLKHRNDVFRIAATLPGTKGPLLPESILTDLRDFLASFKISSPAWPAILASLEESVGTLKPEVLLEAIKTYFDLS